MTGTCIWSEQNPTEKGFKHPETNTSSDAVHYVTFNVIDICITNRSNYNVKSGLCVMNEDSKLSHFTFT